MVAVDLLWALCYPLIALGLDRSPPLAFAAMRAGIAGVALGAYAVATRRRWPTGRRAWTLIALVGACSTGLGFTGMFLAGGQISPGLATVLANVQPLVAGFLAWTLLRERLGRHRMAALGLGFLGIVLVSTTALEGAIEPAGIAWVLVAALGVAAGNVALRALGPHYDPVPVTAAQISIGACLLGLASAATERPITIEWTAPFFLSLFALALLGTGVAAVGWLWLLGRHPLNRLNPFTFLSPVFALAIGALAFGEQLAILQWLGVAAILAASGVAARDPEPTRARLAEGD